MVQMAIPVDLPHYPLRHAGYFVAIDVEGRIVVVISVMTAYAHSLTPWLWPVGRLKFRRDLSSSSPMPVCEHRRSRATVGGAPIPSLGSPRKRCTATSRRPIHIRGRARTFIIQCRR